MTNSEIMLASAVKAMNEGKLTTSERNFIADIQDYSKKELRNLSSNQYNLLRSAASKAE